MRSLLLGILVTVLPFAPLPAQSPMPERARLALDSVIDRVVALELTPGLGVAVVRDGRIVYRRSAGWADREAGRRVDERTVFYIGSITKSFTALATILLDRDGILDLDASLDRILPGVPLAPGLDARTITVRQLLSHTHGISGNGPVMYRAAFSGETDRQQMLAAIAAHRRAPNGNAFAYGNFGYNVLSLAIDSIVGKPWRDVVAERVFRPLGLKSTSGHVSRVPRGRLAMPYRMEPDGLARIPYAKHDANMHAAGGTVSTIGDLARFTIAMMDGGMLNGRRVLPPDVVAEALRVEAPLSARHGEVERFGYALGWYHSRLGDDTLVDHFGGFPGFSAGVSFMPVRRIGVVVAGNGAESGAMGEFVTWFAYALLSGNTASEARLRALLATAPELLARTRSGIEADRARRAARSQVTPLPITAYTGRFVEPAFGSLVVSMRGGRLYVVNGVLESVAEVYDGATHKWRAELAPGTGTVLEFHVEEARVTGVSVEGTRLRRVP